MGWEAPWHWVVLAIVVIALFGYKKLPDASRALGRSLRIFKTEIKGMTEDDKTRDATANGPAAVEPKVVESAPAEQATQQTSETASSAATSDKPTTSAS